MPDTPHSSALRKGRFSEIGRGYLLTMATDCRAPVFLDLVLARRAILALRECDALGFSHTFAFVLMPDHLHWLIELRCGQLSSLVRRFKSTSSRSINRVRHTSGTRIWQPGFHDHALRHDEEMQHIARYVVANPLRAGLATGVRDYLHWDAAWI